MLPTHIIHFLLQLCPLPVKFPIRMVQSINLSIHNFNFRQLSIGISSNLLELHFEHIDLSTCLR
jgi:hypothetical protein